MKYSINLCIAMLAVQFFACNTDNEGQQLNNTIDSLENVYGESQSKESAAELIKAYTERVGDFGYEEEKAEDFYRIADISYNSGNPIMAVSSYIWTLKANPQHDSAEQIIHRIAKIYSSDSSYHDNARLTYAIYREKFPEGKFAGDATTFLNGEDLNIDKYITDVSEQLFDGDKSMRESNIRKFVDACEIFATCLPENEKSPQRIQQAAMMLNSLGLKDKTLSFYDWILQKYPDNSEAENALFSKAFHVYEVNKDEDKANKLYEEYLEKYPEGKYADDANILLKNGGRIPVPAEE